MHMTTTTNPALLLPPLTPTEHQANADAIVPTPWAIYKGQGTHCRLGAVLTDEGWLEAYCDNCLNAKIYFRVEVSELSLHDPNFTPDEILAPCSKGAEVGRHTVLCAPCNTMLADAYERAEKAHNATFAAALG